MVPFSTLIVGNHVTIFRKPVNKTLPSSLHFSDSLLINSFLQGKEIGISEAKFQVRSHHNPLNWSSSGDISLHILITNTMAKTKQSE